MEEIKIKPKLSADIASTALIITLLYVIIGLPTSLIFLVLGEVLVSISILGIGIGIAVAAFAMITIPIIFSKLFLTYYITKENEIVIEYSFLNKMTKVYRIDQLTSLTYTQTWIQKKFNLGSVKFDIFGKTIQPATPQNNNQQPILPEFSSIDQHEKIFQVLSQKLDITPEKDIYTTKPKTSPTTFGFSITFILLILIAFVISLVNIVFSIIPVTLILLLLPIYIINLKRIQNTNYSISQNYIETNHNYFFSRKISKVPISKITNLKSSKNAITHTLFGVGKSLLFTGGMNDPQYTGLSDYKTFTYYLSKLSKGEKITAQHSNANNNSSELTNEESQKAEFITKTSPIYMVKFFLKTTPFFLLIIAVLLFFNFTIIATIVGILFIIISCLQYLYYRSLRYEFYTYKIIKYSGIITTVSAELHYKNLKYISLKRSMILDRIGKTGTINLYTAGSTSIDKSIVCVKRYGDIYESFEEILEKK